MSTQEQYQMLTDIEHVLIRPHIYIGSVKPASTATEVLQISTDEFNQPQYSILTNQTATLTPGFVTLFNEIINNSYDEYVRTKNNKHGVSQIDVTINVNDNSFIVRDNGGIAVRKHTEHDMWIPTMLFGHLRSGSNYTEERGATSGVNGVGASLVNIFSKKFYVKTADASNEFYQEWSDNLSKSSEPKITKTKDHFTEVYSQLDLERLGMTALNVDAVNKMLMRCLEVAASGASSKRPLTVNVTIIEANDVNQYHFKFNSFNDYVKLFNDIDESNFFGHSTERMSFLIGPSNSDALESTALINSIRTDSGTHVDAIADYCMNHLRWFLNKKHKIDLKPKQIKSAFKIMSSWLIDAPSFTSQTKEVLDKDVKQFGFEIDFGKKLKQQLENSEILHRLIDFHQRKSAADELAKVRDRQKSKVRPQSIAKLIDASSKDRMNCEIFIAEGDSAMNGLRRFRNATKQGGFALGGKFVNALDRSPAQLLKVHKDESKNSKAKTLCDVLGLQFGTKATADNLRYGKIYIMTDADYDGYCISAQLVLFFMKFWPELFDENRVYLVNTPIVIAKNKKETKMYYSLADFEKDESMLIKNKFNIRYIKGLASIETSDYGDIIENPQLIQINKDEHAWDTLVSWFDNDAENRKKLI